MRAHILRYSEFRNDIDQFSFTKKLIITLGTTVAIYLLYPINHFLYKENLLLLSPFIASGLMAFTMPSMTMTSANVIFQSYLLCSLIGFPFVYALDYSQWVIIAAFAICFLLMLLLECLYPPAIMLPILIISKRLRDYTLAFNPIVIDVFVLLAAAYLFNKTLQKFPLANK